MVILNILIIKYACPPPTPFLRENHPAVGSLRSGCILNHMIPLSPLHPPATAGPGLDPGSQPTVLPTTCGLIQKV